MAEDRPPARHRRRRAERFIDRVWFSSPAEERAVVLGVLAGSGRVGEHEIVVRYTTARAER